MTSLSTHFTCPPQRRMRMFRKRLGPFSLPRLLDKEEWTPIFHVWQICGRVHIVFFVSLYSVDVLLFHVVQRKNNRLSQKIINPITEKSEPFSLGVFKLHNPKKIPLIYATPPKGLTHKTRYPEFVFTVGNRRYGRYGRRRSWGRCK